MKLLVLVCCLAAVLAVASAYPRVQYDVNLLQAGFLFDRNRLHTFSPADSIGQIMEHPSITQYFDGSAPALWCKHFKKYIPSTTTVFDAIIHHDPVLHVNIKSMFGVTYSYDVVEMESIEDWKVRVTQEDMLNLHKKELAQYFGAQGGTTAVNTEYPMTKGNIVSRSMATLNGWVTEFLKYHWGELHPFPVYKFQMEELLKNPTNEKIKYSTTSKDINDVGIYHMGTGKKLSIAESRQLALTGQKKTLGQIPVGAAQTTTFGVTGDWGAGTKESQVVADLLAENVDYTLNLGDLYLVGSPEDARKHFLGKRIANDTFAKAVEWKKGKLGSFYIEGNHEAYSRSWGYFRDILPTLGFRFEQTDRFFGQDTSYFVLENDFWRLIFLDTGYTTYAEGWTHNDNNPQPDVVMNWLHNVVALDNSADKRGVVIFTHHDFVSAFKQTYPATSQQLKVLLKDRVVLNFWGHEHKTAIYEKSNLGNITSYPRCIGTGGFPVDSVEIPPTTRTAGLVAFDNRDYDIVTGDLGNVTVGYNGYSKLNFSDATLTVDYYTTQWNADKTDIDTKNGHLTMTEKFNANLKTGNVEQISFNVVDKDITVINNIELNGVPKSSQLLNSGSQLQNAGYSMTKYYAANKDKRYTRVINPEPTYSEDAAKEQLAEFIKQHINPKQQQFEFNKKNGDTTEKCEFAKNNEFNVELDYNQIIEQNGNLFYGVKV